MKKITKIFASVFALLLVCVGAIGLVGCKDTEDNTHQQRVDHVVKLMDDLMVKDGRINAFVEGSTIIPTQANDEIFAKYSVLTPESYNIRMYLDEYQVGFENMASSIKKLVKYEKFEFNKWLLPQADETFYQINYSNNVIVVVDRGESSCKVSKFYYENNSINKVECLSYSIYDEEGPVEDSLYMQITLSTNDSRMLDSYVLVDRCDYSSGNKGYEIDLYSELSGHRYVNNSETNADIQSNINIELNAHSLEIEEYKNQSTTDAIIIPENIFNA